MVPFYLFSISGSNQIVLLMLPHYPLYDSHLQLAASQPHSLGATCLAARCLCAPFQTQLGFFGCAVPAEQLRPKACLTLTPHSYEKRTIHPVVDNYGIILQGGKFLLPAADSALGTGCSWEPRGTQSGSFTRSSAPASHNPPKFKALPGPEAGAATPSSCRAEGPNQRPAKPTSPGARLAPDEGLKAIREFSTSSP